VAAYPVDGPLEVLGKADGSCHGGVMNEDLQQACYSALAVPRHEARLRALDFSWGHAAQLFESFLVIAGKNSATIQPRYTIKGNACQSFSGRCTISQKYCHAFVMKSVNTLVYV
jgi:hypothetical protein